jgi:transcriptional regulator with GAF, ATPase, and Fis domain
MYFYAKTANVMDQSTLQPSNPVVRRKAEERVPGVALIFSNGAPTAAPIRFSNGLLEVGRAETCAARLDDLRVSRRHARIRFDGRRFTVIDLSSQNGTFADGEAVANGTERVVQRTIRVGDSLLVPLSDIGPLERRGVRIVAGFVRGPAMQALLDEVARTSQLGSALHICGKSGTGKEGVAKAFHRATRASGPFVAVNCATIPQSLAERLLFGAKRGAYSGADADTPGYLQEADGGTLFLDEVAELDPSVQAKLLRTTETGEVLPLGAARGRKVDVMLCSATHKDLRALVAAGKLREDLYFRIGRPAVILPALFNRPEEVAYLITEELRRSAPSIEAHLSLIEQCLLRPWPGNVRELLAEVRAAAQVASAEEAQRVSASHLSPTAGCAFTPHPIEPETAPPEQPALKHAEPIGDDRDQTEEVLRQDGGNVSASARSLGLHRTQLQDQIEEALRQHDGNVSASARSLGLHRTQLRRLIERHRIAVGSERDSNQPDDLDGQDQD